MRKIYTLFSLAAALMILTSAGPGYRGRILVRQTTFERDGDSVRIEMNVGLNGVTVSSPSFVLLTPILKTDRQTRELPSVLLNGRNRQKAYERLEGLRHRPEGIQTVIEAGDKNAKQEYLYKVSIPYEQWMEGAEFLLAEEQCDCNGPIIQYSVELLAKTMDYRDRTPATVGLTVADAVLAQPQAPLLATSFIVPEAEPVKRRSESGRAYLDFTQGSAVIRSDYMNNAAELEKIHKLILTLKEDPDATITGMSIDGYASPEGTWASNQTLSEKRAYALKDQIRSIYGFPEMMFTVRGMGENWAQLDTLVQQSYLPDKYQILAIIRGVSIFDGRETKLMALSQGVTYRQMLREMFPKLRYNYYEIRYNILPFTVEKGKQIIKTKPSSLSLNEMFLIAQTYEKGSPQFNEVFEIAARTFPDSDVANLNAAASALSRRDTQAAVLYLGKVSQSSRTGVLAGVFNNNLGVLYTLEGDRTKAAEAFNAARLAGSPEAAANLQRLNNR